jgi:type II secretory ATPase GspE/PulE/Tfp pilus assembly ATPase PilB-like protein
MTKTPRHLLEGVEVDLPARGPDGTRTPRPTEVVPEHASQPGLVAEAVELQRVRDEATRDEAEREDAIRWLDVAAAPVPPVFKMPVPVPPVFSTPPTPVAEEVDPDDFELTEPETKPESAVVAAEAPLPVAPLVVTYEPETPADVWPFIALEPTAEALPEPVEVIEPDAAEAPARPMPVAPVVVAVEPETPADVWPFGALETSPVDAAEDEAPALFAPEPVAPAFHFAIDTEDEVEPADIPAPEVEPSFLPDTEPEAEHTILWLPDADESAPEPEREPVEPEVKTDGEVHIHHHYTGPPVPVAPVIQRVIVVDDERPAVEEPEDVPDYVDYGSTPARQPRADPGPIMSKPVKEPLFVWRDKPLFVGKGNDVPVVEDRGYAADDGEPFAEIADSTQRPAPAARVQQQKRKKRNAEDSDVDGSRINPQTWFEDTVQDCLLLGVSDLHITVQQDDSNSSVLIARIRIDGQMRDYVTIVGMDAMVIINKFKAAASLSSQGNYVPEESTWEVEVEGDIRKARIALFQTATGGEALVLRLPPRGALRRLEDLEFAPNNLELFYSLLRSSNRMVVIAGPMGSGKTTTAHAALAHVATTTRNVWSVEDPVERVIPGLTQLEIDEKNGAGFEAYLPVLVRSDYDTLFLGEIRDKATAAAGVKQSKAGRQVITTIHANDNVTALLRLIELAEDSPMSVMNAVLGVVSQRLVRRLNPGWDGVDPADKYKGRVPVHEVLRVNDDLIEAVMRDKPIKEIKAIAAELSDSTFEMDAARLIAAGVTDQEEVDRVLGSE